jgi:hypothetical protein
MTTYAEDDTYDDYAEDWDLDDEAVRPARSIRTARPASVMARPTDRPVTQAQLQMVVGQFNSRISQNSTAIQRVNASVNGIGRDVRRQGMAVRDARHDVTQLRDLTLILPLLQGAIGDDNQQLALLLPFLLLGGIGGDGRSGGYGGGGLLGGGDGLLLILLLTTVLNNDGASRSSRVLSGSK